ncbi:BZ3500_MvSof-1268-A1-R1_Chr12-2g03833 [Microbotryum saponariae]|uniref:BZ3500_MvSof-1268-A1-R1_Chr12-2g03833 protein n=1 Tax=Microbotryum saponariae TaxID=289078 RepID=A0A2X0LEG7_9BASI|nr:BZ3500_MvSof-1268-A1-R1_Chr12-2g03833 [Microbotryum saponariae]
MDNAVPEPDRHSANNVLDAQQAQSTKIATEEDRLFCHGSEGVVVPHEGDERLFESVDESEGWDVEREQVDDPRSDIRVGVHRASPWGNTSIRRCLQSSLCSVECRAPEEREIAVDGNRIASPSHALTSAHSSDPASPLVLSPAQAERESSRLGRVRASVCSQAPIDGETSQEIECCR